MPRAGHVQSLVCLARKAVANTELTKGSTAIIHSHQTRSTESRHATTKSEAERRDERHAGNDQPDADGWRH